MTYDVGDKVYARDLKWEGVVREIKVWSNGHESVYVDFPRLLYGVPYAQGSRKLRKVRAGV